jgi:RHS repeat-associated protein
VVADLHGSIAADIDNGSNPSFLSAFRYDAYGETVDSYNSAGNTLILPWRYQGRILESADGATDLYDFAARSYDPGLGAFTSFDTVAGSAQNPLSLNRYLYANANPASLVDPDGHWPWDDAAKAVSDAAKATVDAASNVTKTVVNTATTVASTYVNTVSNVANTVTSAASSAATFVSQNASTLAHTTLAVASFVPGLNVGASLLDAGLYAAEGDYMSAGLSLAGAIPGGALLKYGGRMLRAGADIEKGVKIAGDVEKADRLITDAEKAQAVIRDGEKAEKIAADGEKAEKEASKLEDAAACVVRHSFSPDTAVETPDSSRAIAGLKIGDTVEAYDPRTGVTGPHLVTAVMVHTDPVVEHLATDAGPIETTPNHPFFTTDRGWVEAGQLRVGEQIRTDSATPATVSGFTTEATPSSMWDLTVADAHSFFVGAGAVLVHNCSPSQTLSKNISQATKLQPQAGEAAHHIVAYGSKKAQEARDILAKFNVGINSAENGVFLKASYHAATHTNNYYQALTDALRPSGSKDEALSVLDQFRNRLLGGFKW